ncbi:MAG TPA: PsiF family protein [Stellaceae bacterium]|nr:PsiF family protein [Stellaceae bacterium]
MAGATMLIFASFAQPPALAQNSQQALMKTCNTEATTQKLAGEARKTFMSDCLSAKSAKTLSPQQQKMTKCNTQASSQKLTGDARKKFMSTCLKG